MELLNNCPFCNNSKECEHLLFSISSTYQLTEFENDAESKVKELITQLGKGEFKEMDLSELGNLMMHSWSSLPIYNRGGEYLVFLASVFDKEPTLLNDYLVLITAHYKKGHKKNIMAGFSAFFSTNDGDFVHSFRHTDFGKYIEYPLQIKYNCWAQDPQKGIEELDKYLKLSLSFYDDIQTLKKIILHKYLGKLYSSLENTKDLKNVAANFLFAMGFKPPEDKHRIKESQGLRIMGIKKEDLPILATEYWWNDPYIEGFNWFMKIKFSNDKQIRYLHNSLVDIGLFLLGNYSENVKLHEIQGKWTTIRNCEGTIATLIIEHYTRAKVQNPSEIHGKLLELRRKGKLTGNIYATLNFLYNVASFGMKGENELSQNEEYLCSLLRRVYGLFFREILPFMKKEQII
jgi:hypothetical protein